MFPNLLEPDISRVANGVAVPIPTLPSPASAYKTTSLLEKEPDLKT